MIYCIHFIVFTGIFWGLYHWLLRKETFFLLNRIYLLITPLLAALLPFLKIEQLRGVASVVPTPVNLPSLWITNSSAPMEEAASGMSTIHLLIGIYGVGVLISGILFLYKILKIQRLKKMGRLQEDSGSKIIWLPDTEGAFSFWGIAFIGEKLDSNSLNQVLLHEQEHIRQKHSWDLCYYETLRMLFWFNPFLLLMHRDLSEIHEFAVDRQVTRAKSKKDYVNSLLNVNFQTEQLSFTNSFLTQNQLKTRIMMLYKQSSHRLAKLKYVSLLPVLLLMIFYVSSTNLVQSQEKPLTQKTAKEATQEDSEAYSLSDIDTSPEFLDAPDFKNEKERKSALSNGVQRLVNSNFNVDIVANSKKDKSVYKIKSKFTIDENGEVKDIVVQADLPEIEEETRRVFQKLPKFKPAKLDGTPVAVEYHMPIVFRK